MKGVLLQSSKLPRPRNGVRNRTRGRGDRAQSLVEFALVAPFLIILMLGVIDYGRVYFAYVSVTNGARTGADFASSGESAAEDIDGIRSAALAETLELLNTSPENPQVSVETGTDSQGRAYADVTMQYTFTTIFPWPGLPSSMDVVRTVRARVAE